MANQLLHGLLLCSVSGAVMLVLSAAANRLMRGKSMEKWRYASLVTSVLLFLVPLSRSGNIPKAISIEIPADTAAMRTVDAASQQGVPQGFSSVSVSTVIFAIWAAVCAALVIKNIICYVKADRRIRRICEDIRDDDMINTYEDVCALMQVRPRARLVRCADISTPMLFGAVRPLLIMPQRDFSYDETAMIFAHELTHYRHRDIYIKLAALLAKCVHWFNPAVYFLPGAINRACELCCDESVLRLLSPSDKKDYGRLLLSVMEGGSAELKAYSTSMSSSKKHIKSRLIKIAQFKEATNMIKAIGILTAVSMAVCSVTAFGFTQAAELVPENVAQILEPAAPPKPENTPQPAAAYETEQTPAPPAEPEQTAPAFTPEALSEETAAEHETEAADDSAAEPTAPVQEAEDEPKEEAPAITPVPQEEPQGYSFESEEYTPEPPSTDAAAPQPENAVVSVSEGAGYILSPDFENGSQSVEITAESNAYLKIRSGGDIQMRLLKADTMEVLGNSSQAHSGFSLNVNSGERYILEMSGDGGADAKVYIYSY